MNVSTINSCVLLCNNSFLPLWIFVILNISEEATTLSSINVAIIKAAAPTFKKFKRKQSCLKANMAYGRIVVDNDTSSDDSGYESGDDMCAK